MAEDTHDQMLVTCTECPFSREVAPEDDELPADVLIEHGRDTGHTLDVERLDE